MAGGEHPSCHYCFVTNYKLSKHIPQELEKESVAEYVVRYNRVWHVKADICYDWDIPH